MKKNRVKSQTITILFCVILGFSKSYAQTVPNSAYSPSTDLNLIAPIGQLVLGNGYNMTNAPFGDASYWHILSMRHENPNNNFTTQIAGEFFGNRLAFRNTRNLEAISWNEIYHSGNINTLKTALANAGNIGIGTTTPQEKLSVNGKIRAHEIKVETANWPDYVFADAYTKLSLPELENYIKQHRHLPEMPSAKQLEANGVELGDMVKLQQKKIEELTLYLIEKNKELDKERDRITVLEALVKEMLKKN